MARKQLIGTAWLEKNANRMNRLSARQFSMATYLESLPGRVVDIDTLDRLHQGTVRSFLVRGYLVQRGADSAYWTKDGSSAVKRFPSEKFERNPSMRFTSLLNLVL